MFTVWLVLFVVLETILFRSGCFFEKLKCLRNIQ